MTYEDYEWFCEADKSGYDNQWVAVINKEIIAANTDIKKVIAQAKAQYPSKKPILAKVRNQLQIL